MNQRRQQAFLALIGMFALTVAANWPLATFQAYMKWDATDLQMPLAECISACLRHGTLPLWNPLLAYGYPQCAQVGTSPYYPSTFILALLGYNAQMLAIEYLLHVVLAGFFMYLLVVDHLRDTPLRGDEVNESTFLAAQNKLFDPAFSISLASGIFYAFSGMFISNAEHIPIIISCALLPLSFLLVRRYIATKRTVYLLWGGLVFGMNLTGGYPGIFFISFTALVPYIVWEHLKIGDAPARSLLAALKTSGMVAAFTIFASAVSLLPFLQASKHITRGAMSYDYIKYGSLAPRSLVSMIVPGMAGLHSIIDPMNDISMMDMHCGLLVLAFFIYSLWKRHRDTLFITLMALFALMMSLGDNGGLHFVFYKFVPLYNTFRFPSLWRAITALFLVLGFAIESKRLIEDSSNRDFKTIAGILLGLSILTFTLLVAIRNSSELKNQISAITSRVTVYNSFRISCGLLLAYAVTFFSLRKKQHQTYLCIAILLFTSAEVLVFHQADFSVTIAESDIGYRNYIDSTTANKNADIEFKNSRLCSIFPRISNRDIVKHAILEEESYNPFRFLEEKFYNQFYNRYIAESRPVAYFTSNVVSVEKDELAAALNDLEPGGGKIFVVGNGNGGNPVPSIYERATLRNSFHNIAAIEHEESAAIIKLDPYTVTISTGVLAVTMDIEMPANASTKQNVTLEYLKADGAVLKKFEGTVNLHPGINQKSVFVPRSIDASSIRLTFDRKTAVRVGNCDMGEAALMEGTEPVQIISFKPNTASFAVNNKERGYLVFQQHDYPGWKAFDNETEVAIEKINGVFMGVALQPGNHDIDFKYRPTEFYLGAAISLVYLTVCVASLVFARFRSVDRALH